MSNYTEYSYILLYISHYLMRMCNTYIFVLFEFIFLFVKKIIIFLGACIQSVEKMVCCFSLLLLVFLLLLLFWFLRMGMDSFSGGWLMLPHTIMKGLWQHAIPSWYMRGFCPSPSSWLQGRWFITLHYGVILN